MEKSKYRILSLMTLLGLLSNPLEVSAHLTIDEVKEADFEALANGKDILVGTTIIENDEKEVLSNNIVRFVDGLKLGDIVLANGIGNAEACGKGIETRKVSNETMVIVGTKNDEVYPYALAKVSEKGEVGDVIGWFKGEDLKARISFKKMRDYADIERTIVDASDALWYLAVGVYNPNTESYEVIPYNYDWYGNDYAISYEYVWPEVDKVYDCSLPRDYKDSIDIVEYWKSDDENNKIYRYKDLKNGTVDYTTVEARDKVSMDEKALAKRYGMKSY